MFFEFTRNSNGIRESINKDHIIRFYPYNMGTMIETTGYYAGDGIQVRETYETVKQTLNNYRLGGR